MDAEELRRKRQELFLRAEVGKVTESDQTHLDTLFTFIETCYSRLRDPRQLHTLSLEDVRQQYKGIAGLSLPDDVAEDMQHLYTGLYARMEATGQRDLVDILTLQENLFRGSSETDSRITENPYTPLGLVSERYRFDITGQVQAEEKMGYEEVVKARRLTQVCTAYSMYVNQPIEENAVLHLEPLISAATPTTVRDPRLVDPDGQPIATTYSEEAPLRRPHLDHIV